MDLALYSRVFRRFRLLLAAGLVVGVVLAVFSYYNVSFDGWKPTLTNRKAEVWQVPSTIFLASTRPAQTYTDPGRYTGLAPLYAQFANSDPVRRAALLRCGRLEGGYKAIPAADNTYGVINGLPMVSVLGTGPTPNAAEHVSRCATAAFLTYMQSQQIFSQIPTSQRVQMTVINTAYAHQAQLVVPRKKTLPIVVFLAVAFATIALAFILENVRPSIRALQTPEDVRDVRRTA